MNFFDDSVFFGVAISILSYGFGILLNNKFKLAIFNPLLISIVATIVVLLVSGIDYKVYNSGAKYLNYLLTPATVLGMSVIFGLNHTEYVTMLPKSITTAIGIGVSEELKGNVTLTCVIIIVTGVLGNIIAPAICKLFKIKDPIAKGIAIGTASHAVGTAKAMEMGETEGAMSSLSIAVSGLMTVIGASI